MFFFSHFCRGFPNIAGIFAPVLTDFSHLSVCLNNPWLYWGSRLNWINLLEWITMPAAQCIRNWVFALVCMYMYLPYILTHFSAYLHNWPMFLPLTDRGNVVAVLFILANFLLREILLYLIFRPSDPVCSVALEISKNSFSIMIISPVFQK